MSGQGGWANPGPAGLTALAVACFTFYAVLSGKVDHSCVPLLGCWLIGGFVVQLLVGIIELMEGVTLGGNVFTFFAAFFMLTGGIEFFVKYLGAVNGLTIDARIDGWAWIVLFVTLWLWTPAYLKTGPLALNIVVLALDVATPFVAFRDLGMADPASSAAWAANFLLIAGIFGIYVAAGIILNTAFGKTILPLGKPPLA
ncbi:MAG: GPR1/FUN34/YaaH family transporter [Syntrophomonadaceae bacterium]|jgi:succinate-acetate transporter protein|nr:GPR1/FUN34/YaaH family transporter [Syntrophomonadaceae bacterium]MDH7497474.1 GPR1/FUN34/YaaH family transporter [Syntrophomonadaceae bacterium]